MSYFVKECKMIVELLEENGIYVIKDTNGGVPWQTTLTVGTPLQEVSPTANKRYIKDALKLKEAGFEADEVLELLKEAHA